MTHAEDAILNPAPERLELEPVPLSRALLDAARQEDSPRLTHLAGQLHRVEPVTLPGDAVRQAFWINLYNALACEALRRAEVSGHLLRHLGVFSRSAWRVGAHAFSLNDIEHGILRANHRAPGMLRQPFRPGDPRQAAAPSALDPRIHFAISCGALSCPPIRAYEPERLEEQLQLATRAYVQAQSELDRPRRAVMLPYLCKLYGSDFGAPPQRVRFVAPYLPEADGAWLLEHSERVRIHYGPYDWTVVSAAIRFSG